MKPSFALNLDHDGISLLHRQSGGWRILGEVALDSPDFSETLKFLRRTAIEMATGRFACKVIIPNSQVLYTDMPVAETVAEARRAEIGHALEKLTPYRSDQLAFTWVDAAPNFVRVAAVARETLDEAEEFATEHRFAPMCFVAIPPAGKFPGEPVFALSKIAPDLLQGDETLEPETEAIHILDENYDSDQGPVAGTEDEFPPTGAEAPPPVTKRRIGRPPKALEPGLDFQIKAPTDPLGISVPAKAAPAGAGATGPSAAAPIPQVAESEKDHSARAILWAAAGILLLVLALAIAAERFFFGGAVTNYLLQGALTEPASSVPFDEATPGDPGTPALARLVGGQRKISASEGLELSLPLGPDIATMPGTGVFTPILQSNDTALPVLSDAAPQPPPLAEGSVVASSRGLPGTEFEVPEEVAGSNWTDQQTTFASIAPDFSPFTDQAPTDEELAEGELDDPDNLPVVSLDDADRIYAATGIWVRSPAAPLDADLSDAMDMEQLYVASIDPPVTSQDAFAMPQERDMAPDISLPRFALPAQDGQVFELDASGLVALTPEGRLNQDGVMVYAGSPPLPGKARPEGLVPPELLGPDLEKLAQFRPRPRPGTLAESAERARLGGMSLTEMAAFRPKPRPASAQENISGGGTATVLAMARSAPPKPRPANFASIVQQTKAAEERRQQAAAAARVSVPTSANVADRATADRALRLGQLNLIGVFGSSSNRRALVRLPSGRFLKVQIGDNLDGGRVAAIDSSSLIYVKSGKSLRLEIPAG